MQIQNRVEKHKWLCALLSPHERLLSGAIWSLLGALCARGLNFAAILFVARLLGQFAFGQFSMLQATVAMFAQYAALGLGATATKYVADYRGQDKTAVGDVIGSCLFLATLSGMIATAALVLTSPLLANTALADPGLSSGLMICSILVLFSAVDGCQIGALLGLEAFKSCAIVNIAAGILAFPTILALGIRYGLSGALLGSVLNVASKCALNAIVLRRECNKRQIRVAYNRLFSLVPMLWRFSLPMFLSGAIMAPATWICSALLVHQPHGYQQLGLFSAADRGRLLILFCPSIMAQAALPILTSQRLEPASFEATRRTNIILNTALTTALAIPVALVARPIMSLYGDTFQSGWPILAVLSLSTIATTLNTVLGQPLISRGRAWTRFSFDGLLALVLLTTAALLIPRIGALGLAAAYCIAFSVVAIVLRMYSTREWPHVSRPTEMLEDTLTNVTLNEIVEPIR
jgi:O-antigen/teichoic acid export membrane protein